MLCMVCYTYWDTCDKNRDDAKIMHDKESMILKTLGYNVPKVEDGLQ